MGRSVFGTRTLIKKRGWQYAGMSAYHLKNSEAPRFAFIKGTGGIKAPTEINVRRQQ